MYMSWDTFLILFGGKENILKKEKNINQIWTLMTAGLFFGDCHFTILRTSQRVQYFIQFSPELCTWCLLYLQNKTNNTDLTENFL